MNVPFLISKDTPGFARSDIVREPTQHRNTTMNLETVDLVVIVVYAVFGVVVLLTALYTTGRFYATGW